MATISDAIREALPLAQKAVEDGAQAVFLPEYCGGLVSDGATLVPPVAPDASHEMVARFCEFAKDQQVYVMIGSVAVAGPGQKYFNRGFMIKPNGQVMGRYDKIHMFDIQLSEHEVYRESATVSPGNRAVLHETSLGKIGHTICYDLRFAELYRCLAQAGAEMLCVPAAFTKKTGAAHWHALNRARAIENGSFVVAPCAIGPVPGGGESYGHSLIIDPWGVVLADGGDTPGVVSAEIDLDKVAEARARIPSLTHDRPYTLTSVDRRSA